MTRHHHSVYVVELHRDVLYERRFRAADKDGDGRLSRTEAYAEFPRAPKFFDEIDADRDRHVTLVEFNRAMERRAATALGSGSLGAAARDYGAAALAGIKAFQAVLNPAR